MVIVALVEEDETEEIRRPLLKSTKNLSIVSLVTLFLRSLVTISPMGDLFAYVNYDSGFDS